MQAYPYGATAMAGYGGAYNMAAGTFILMIKCCLSILNFASLFLSLSLSVCVCVYVCV